MVAGPGEVQKANWPTELLYLWNKEYKYTSGIDVAAFISSFVLVLKPILQLKLFSVQVILVCFL